MKKLFTIFIFHLITIHSSQNLLASAQSLSLEKAQKEYNFWQNVKDAIQLAHAQEIDKLTSQITRTEARSCHATMALSIARYQAQHQKYHPTTRKTYYDICKTLKDRGVISDYYLPEMPTLEEMMQEHWNFHQNIINKRKECSITNEDICSSFN